MKSFVLNITKEVHDRTTEIVAWCESNPVSYPVMKKRAIDFEKGKRFEYTPPPETVQEIERGFRVVYSIEEHDVDAPWKHISISCLDPWPPKIAVGAIMHLYGFTFSIDDCKVWPEKVDQKHIAVNIMQPHGDWYKVMMN